MINQSLVQIYSCTKCYMHISVLQQIHKRVAGKTGIQNTDMPFIIDCSTSINERCATMHAVHNLAVGIYCVYKLTLSKWQPSGFWHLVRLWINTDVSDEHSASIFWVMKLCPGLSRHNCHLEDVGCTYFQNIGISPQLYGLRNLENYHLISTGRGSLENCYTSIPSYALWLTWLKCHNTKKKLILTCVSSHINTLLQHMYVCVFIYWSHCRGGLNATSAYLSGSRRLRMEVNNLFNGKGAI